MHERVRQFSGIRNEQQTRRIEVKATNRNPLVPANFWKRFKDCSPSLRIAPRHNLPDGLVVDEHSLNSVAIRFYFNGFIIESKYVTRSNPIPQDRNTIAKPDASLLNPSLDFATRTLPGCRKDLLNSLALCLRHVAQPPPDPLPPVKRAPQAPLVPAPVAVH